MDNNRDYFKLKPKEKGLFRFEGVVTNDKPIDNITINNRANTAVINYDDNSTYTVNAQIQDGTNGNIIISNIKNKWYNENVYNNGTAMESALSMLVSAKLNTWKEMSSVTRVHNKSTGANTVTIIYEDGDEYKLSCIRAETDTTATKTIALTNIHEYWNNEEIFDNE